MAKTDRKSYHVYLNKTNMIVLGRLVSLSKDTLGSMSAVIDALIQVWIKGQLRKMAPDAVQTLFGNLPIPDWAAEFTATQDVTESEVSSNAEPDPLIGEPIEETANTQEPPPLGEAAPAPEGMEATSGKKNF